MIQLPERAVTRFFVPLIDVLILLFCIFLLLPFVSAPGDKAAPDSPTELDALRADLKKAKDELTIEKKRTDELMRERADSAQRTVVWTLDIDGETGEMSYTAPTGVPGTRFRIATAEDAAQFIRNAKKGTGGRAIKFLFVCPRKASRYPDKKTLDDIAAWFAGESVAIDNPFAPR